VLLMPRVIPVQARAKERYEKILAVAKSYFWEVGPDHFDLQVVADRVGCSLGTIYRYFPNKEDLLDEVAPERTNDEEAIRKLLPLRERTDLPEQLWLEALDILDSYFPRR
jgi:AcrR family transcriptional regulator